ncbi:MAG: gluconate 5-dehydrogenase [Magnetovibrio sp.]|nr:gluconate 5-dehydrogenase [Magnetovibrio sp.]
MQLFNLTGKTALITGSSGGLGLGMARGLGQAGAHIILNSRSPERLIQPTQQLEKEGIAVSSLVFDVSNETAVLEAFRSLDEKKVIVDILVNNAGINHREHITDLALVDWQRIIDTNLTSAFVVGREAGKRMLTRNRGGKIINIGSLTSAAARASIAPYTAAKGGIKMLTRAMAAEWAEHNIQINAIGPGYMATELTRVLAEDPEFDSWMKARTPARRWGTPDDLAGAAIFLASAASDYINGQIIYIDDGLLAVM